MMWNDKPKRCIDPVIKYCQECPWGHVVYPSWVETREDLEGCTFDVFCTLGYDKGRPEDEPTEEEMKEFDEWIKRCEESRKTDVSEEDKFWDFT